MRDCPGTMLEAGRIKRGPMASDASCGMNGAFFVWHKPTAETLKVIASDGRDWSGLPGDPWEHVSVSVKDRTPTWEEMDFIKRLFWFDDETVMQLHVPREQHINFEQNCLHPWKPIGKLIPLPPPICV